MMSNVKNIVFDPIMKNKMPGLKLGVLRAEKILVREDSELVSQMIQTSISRRSFVTILMLSLIIFTLPSIPVFQFYLNCL
jgi:hypothetical protein